MPVPDDRLDALATISKTQKSFLPVLSLSILRGSCRGIKREGLGNKFLANIREASAIVHVVRCFDNDDIVHVDGSVDPVRDINIINTELILSDVEQCEKAIESQKENQNQ